MKYKILKVRAKENAKNKSKNISDLKNEFENVYTYSFDMWVTVLILLLPEPQPKTLIEVTHFIGIIKLNRNQLLSG